MAKAAKFKESDGTVIRGYWCDVCEETFREGNSTNYITLYRADDDDQIDGGPDNGYTYYGRPIAEIEAWRCETDCWHMGESEPEITDLYKCGNCTAVYTDLDATEECCL